MPRLSLLAVLLCLLALPLSACGGGSGANAEQPASSTPDAGPTPTADETVKALADSISKDLKTKPELAIPAGGTPTKLTKVDIVTGSGRKAKPGDTVEVAYVGSSWSTGSEFDTSWGSGQPFSFALGGGQVIKGWDQGVAGMRVGGRRLLVIPPELGYGAQGSPPKIAANETLAFVVDLTKIK
jgi:FKBP-type peptidyl-prolyl cis-trans isomerase